jgi:hypothetical protein
LKRPGYTLAEVLAATFAMGLLLTALTQMSVALERAAQYSLVRADLQNGALVGLNRLSRELRGSSPLTLTILSQPMALSFREQAPGPYTSVAFTPDPTFIVYYFDPDLHALIRKTAVVVSAGSGRLDAATLTQLVADWDGTEHAVACDAASVQIDPPTFPIAQVANTIGLTLGLQEPLNSTESVSLTMTTAVMLRNSP